MPILEYKPLEQKDLSSVGKDENHMLEVANKMFPAVIQWAWDSNNRTRNRVKAKLLFWMLESKELSYSEYVEASRNIFHITNYLANHYDFNWNFEHLETVEAIGNELKSAIANPGRYSNLQSRMNKQMETAKNSKIRETSLHADPPIDINA